MLACYIVHPTVLECLLSYWTWNYRKVRSDNRQYFITPQLHPTDHFINSLAPDRSECDSKTGIFNFVLLIGISRSSHDKALWWMPQDVTDDKSTLVQVMAWCRQATSHYLNQCWPRSPTPYGVTRPQWVDTLSAIERSLDLLLLSSYWISTPAVGKTQIAGLFASLDKIDLSFINRMFIG